MKSGKSKGQASVEFMLLIVLILFYINTIVQPSLNIGTTALQDTTRIGAVRLSAQKIANAIDYIGSLSGDAKTRVNVFIPTDTVIYCDPSNPVGALIGFRADVNLNTTSCGFDLTPFNCDRNFYVAKNVILVCNWIGLKIDSNSGPNPREIKIEKTNGKVYVS